jgi:Tfp pilus assembly protein PilV
MVHQTRDGFSLVETLMTTTVVVTGLSALLLLFSYSVRTNIQSRHRTTATALLANKMEDLRFDPNPQEGEYSEFVSVEGVSVPYRQVWKIAGSSRQATVVVYIAGAAGGHLELARGTVIANSGK